MHNFFSNIFFLIFYILAFNFITFFNIFNFIHNFEIIVRIFIFLIFFDTNRFCVCVSLTFFLSVSFFAVLWLAYLRAEHNNNSFLKVKKFISKYRTFFLFKIYCKCILFSTKHVT